MVQVNGIWRLLTQRFSRDFAGKVKYSTLCPSRIDSPCDASRAMPTRRGFSGAGSKGRDAMYIGRLFAYNRPAGFLCQPAGGRRERDGLRDTRQDDKQLKIEFGQGLGSTRRRSSPDQLNPIQLGPEVLLLSDCGDS